MLSPPRFPLLLRTRASVWTTIVLCAGLYWICAWTASRELPAVADEVAHVVGGLFEWKYGVSHLQPENAYVMKRWATLPLRGNPVTLAAVPPDVPFDSAMLVVGHRTFYESGNDPAALLRVTRGMAAAVGAVLVFFIGAWGLRLWGPAGGVLAALVAALCPTLLANGGLVMSDVPLALGLLAAATASWWMLEAPSFWRVLVCGGALAFALLAKMSGVLALPLLGLLAILRYVLPDSRSVADRPRPLRLIVGVLASIVFASVGLWAAYGFRFSMFAHTGAPQPVYTATWATFAASDNVAVRLVAQFRQWRLLPEFWLYGLAHTLDHLGGRHAFLNGEVKIGSWPLFFPYAWLVKTPLALFGLMGLGVVALFRSDFGKISPVARTHLHATVPLVALFALYWIVALTSQTNIGHRHLLPIYPPMLILTGGAATFWSSTRRGLKLLAVTLPVVLAVESWLIRPDYLAYFNVIAGGPSGAYRHLVDSSLDAGQDLGALGQWWRQQLAVEGKNARLFLSYFGPADPVTHGVAAVRFGDTGFDSRPRAEPAVVRGGWYALSVTLYQGLYTLTPGKWTAEREAIYQRLLPQLRERAPTPAEAVTFEHLQFGRLRHWLSARTPDRRVGYTLLLFRLTDDEVNAALYGPLKPAG